jgi:excisionase family DNA binding protein
MSDDELLTVEQVAELLKLGRITIYELIDAGELPSIKIGRCRRIPTSAIGAFIQRKLEEAANA